MHLNTVVTRQFIMSSDKFIVGLFGRSLYYLCLFAMPKVIEIKCTFNVKFN